MIVSHLDEIMKPTTPLPQGLSHPAHRAEFHSAQNFKLNGSERQNIKKRFGRAYTEPVLHALDIAMRRGAYTREEHELHNLHRLVHGAKHARAYLHRYNDLAGQPDDMLDYLRFFSEASSDYFTRQVDAGDNVSEILKSHFQEIGRSNRNKTIKPVGKIALEMIGCFQRGDWESTDIIDEPIRGLGKRLRANADLGYQELETPGQKQITYRFFKLPILSAEGTHDFGLLTRRRKVADVLTNLGIFKQSHAVVAFKFLEENTQELASEVPFGTIDRNGAAYKIGLQFEDDIRSQQGISVATIPVSAHYLAIAKQSAERPV